MQDTMFGIINIFMNHQGLTNTDHPPHGIMLRQIAAFYHEALVKEAFEDGGEQLFYFLIHIH
jgi:hypothetical protein